MTTETGSIRSSDGTHIAYDIVGDGPALVLVDGAFGNRSFPSELPALLAPGLTVVRYDRRGRNDSGDTPPYAVEREIEDLAAVIAATGRSASLFGMSSGAVVALDAAAAGLPIDALALYEPPLIVDDSRPPVADDYVARLDDLSASGRAGDAVAYFLTEAVGLPAGAVAGMRGTPVWPALEAVAHTLAYDGRFMAELSIGRPLPAARWAAVTAPVLVMDGGASAPWWGAGAQALVDVLPNARRRTLEGQTHDVAMEVLAPALREFLAAAVGAPA